MNIRIISAGAGSGKTYRLTEEMVNLLKGKSGEKVRASGIIATTFTKKAASELQERVRVKLLESGMSDEADDLANAMIGTVHSLGTKLLKRFAFEAGVSPEVDIIADEDVQVMFNESLASILKPTLIGEMEALAERLGFNKKDRYDWRKEVRSLTDIARSNNFSEAILLESRDKSLESFFQYLPEKSDLLAEEFNTQFLDLMDMTLHNIRNNEDSTKTTQTTLSNVQNTRNNLAARRELNWYEWVRIWKGGAKIGKKSREDYEELASLAAKHNTHPQFHADIRAFVSHIFEIAIAALNEYDLYKKRRGLIDYTDMEVSVLYLLDHPQVKAVLQDEIDLLMVDEFQDTNPIQLEIFLKLSRLANHSVWVGDPKQSIYGFRGAEPALMQAIIEKTGGVKSEDIQKYSWRSREDLVYAANALFCKAFSHMPQEQVALEPQRTKSGNANFLAESIELDTALKHWHFQHEGGKRPPGKPWTESCIAASVRQLLEEGLHIVDRHTGVCRKAMPGDISVLCRSNRDCLEVADALHREGLKAAIARNGLTDTPEAQLVLACLKYILYSGDSLSVAEILRLASNYDIKQIIELRLSYLDKKEKGERPYKWTKTHLIIDQLDELRQEVTELSGSELLNLVIEELDLRRIIATWGNARQRFDNIDALRKIALGYEDACNRLHSAASLGGFLLWLNEKANESKDEQGARENPEAVNVMTYHRSKGLEWNVVICHSLENTLRDKVWGMSIVAENEEVDLENPLANRWLRYWINPYADQVKGTDLQENIDQSKVKLEAQMSALQEEARLLYVGMTRARDYLILPTRQAPTKWLNRVSNEGDENIPTLDSESYESPWTWAEKAIQIDTKIAFFDKQFEHAGAQQEVAHYFEERAGSQSHPMLKPDIIENEDVKFNIVQQIEIQPVKARDDADEHTVSSLYRAFLFADMPDADNVEREKIATQLIHEFEVVGIVEEKYLLNASSNFYTFLQKNIKINKLYKNYPVSQNNNGQLFEAVTDMLLETDKGNVIIQYNSNAIHIKKLNAAVKDVAPVLHRMKACTNAVECWVYFGLSGVLVQVVT